MITSEMETVTVAEQPDLTELGWELTADAFPEYNNHGDVVNVGTRARADTKSRQS